MAAPMMAATMPMASFSGLALKADGVTMLPEMVCATGDPTKKAPANSHTAARRTALRIVSAPLPTDVPKALATSLAPMFQAI